MFADVKLHVHISLLFTACLRHCYLPSACMDSIILPVVKDKGGGLTDIDNYYKPLHFLMLRRRF